MLADPAAQHAKDTSIDESMSDVEAKCLNVWPACPDQLKHGHISLLNRRWLLHAINSGLSTDSPGASKTHQHSRLCTERSERATDDVQ